MLELSLAEILFIAVVALVFIGPKELPGALRGVNRFVRQVRGMMAEVKGSMSELLDESGVDAVKRELEEDIQYITDLEGKPQRTYDVSELHKQREAEAARDE